MPNLGLHPGEVIVTVVSLSSPAVKLAALDSLRQRQYARLAAESYKLELLLAQVVAQQARVDTLGAAYNATVREMDTLGSRNQPPLTYSH